MHPAFEACNMPEETDAPAGRPSLLAEGVGFEPTAPLRAYLISSYLRASFDEDIKVTLSHHSIEQTRMNQGFSGKNHEFTTLRLEPRI